MGLIKAAVGAVGGTLADQWKDFLTVPADVQPTAALFPAVPVGTNAGVDFDYLPLAPETKIGEDKTLYLPFLYAVTANGNAVVIEKARPDGEG